MTWNCPKCGSARLKVFISVWATLSQDGENFSTEADGDHEWDGNSGMQCESCGHGDNADQFETEEEAE